MLHNYFSLIYITSHNYITIKIIIIAIHGKHKWVKFCIVCIYIVFCLCMDVYEYRFRDI